MSGCEFCGYANRTAEKTLHIVEETEPRIFISVHGNGYVQIFDEDYPGFVDGFYVNFCPMCGARLRSGHVGGEPPKEVLTGTDMRGGIRRDDAGNVIDWGITGPPGDVGKTEEGE